MTVTDINIVGLFRTNILFCLKQVKQFIRVYLLPAIAVMVVINILTISISTFQSWNAYTDYEKNTIKYLRLSQISGELLSDDRLFTSATWLYILTGDQTWYDEYQGRLEPSLKVQAELNSIAKDQVADIAKSAEDSAKILFRLEEKAFTLVMEGKKDEALKLIISPEYKIQKDIFSDSGKEVLKRVNDYIQGGLSKQQKQLYASLFFSATMVPFLLVIGVSSVAAVRYYIRDRQRALNDVQEARGKITDLGNVVDTERLIRIEYEKKFSALEDDIDFHQAEIITTINEFMMGNFQVRAYEQEGEQKGTIGVISYTVNCLLDKLEPIFEQLWDTAKILKKKSTSIDNQAKELPNHISRKNSSVPSLKEVISLYREHYNLLISLNPISIAAKATSANLEGNLKMLETINNLIENNVTTLTKAMSDARNTIDAEGQRVEGIKLSAVRNDLEVKRRSLKNQEESDNIDIQILIVELQETSKKLELFAGKSNDGISKIDLIHVSVADQLDELQRNIETFKDLVDSTSKSMIEVNRLFKDVPEIFPKLIGTAKKAITVTNRLNVLIESKTPDLDSQQDSLEFNLATLTANITEIDTWIEQLEKILMKIKPLSSSDYAHPIAGRESSSYFLTPAS